MKDIGHPGFARSNANASGHAFYLFSRFSLLAAALALAACASRTPAPVEERGGYAHMQTGAEYYTVKSGDTLYSIARAHNIDHRDLIALNNIENADQITVGRTLRLRPQGGAGTTMDAAHGVETQPIAINQGIEQRTLGATATTGGVADTSASAGSNSAMFKREPKAGKEPYSEQALALALAQGPALPKTPEAATVTAGTAAQSAQPVEAGRKDANTAGEAGNIANAASSSPSWIWPASGTVLSHFGEKGNKGVDVSGKHGDAVNAAQDGKVIIASNALRGYGHMIIIKHAENLVSVYAHNSKLLVKEGQRVGKGQKIAEMGNTDADRVKLHFEIRIQGKPIDPMKYLPAR